MMEGLFIWIVIGAGLTLAFLGVLLIASERELKTKRREVEALLAKVEGLAEEQAQPSTAAPDHGAELTQLRASNQELKNQVAGLTAKLELSRRSIEELQAAQPSHADAEREAQQLQAANERLKMEVNELRARLAETHSSTTSSHGANQQSAQAQIEIDQLKQKLEWSQRKIHELEIAQQNLPNLNEIESRHRAEQQALQTRIAALDQELTASREKLRELDALHERAAEAERSQQELRAEIERHEQELPRWQARIAENEQHRQQLAALRAPFDDLLAKQTALADRQRELQDDIAAFGRLIAVAQTTDADGASTTPSASSPLGNGRNEQSAAQTPAAEQPTTADQSEPKKARRFGIFPAVIVLAIGGAFGAWHFSTDSAQSNVPALDSQQVAAHVPAPAEIANHSTRLERMKPAAPTVVPAAKATPAPVSKETREAVSVPSAQPAPRAVTYEVTKASQVYAAPSEFSQALGDIEAGTKVSVVNSRDGWLEIHSKHGRPPGFIRKEAAARAVAQN